MTPTAYTFEDRLLDALLDRFDDLAPQPTLTAAPVRHRARIRRYAVPAGCMAVAATAASVILVAQGGSPPATHVGAPTSSYALAAWTTQPSSADQAQVSAAEGLCAASLSQTGISQSTAVQKLGPIESGGPWNSALVDTRGDLTLALYTDGTNWIACLDSPSFVSMTPFDSTSELPVADNSASLDRVSTRQASGDVYTVAFGRTGSAVTGVGLVRVGGPVVTATVGNGCFIAWWPGSEGVSALSVTTDAGTQNYPVDGRFARSGPQPNNKAVRSTSDSPTDRT